MECPVDVLPRVVDMATEQLTYGILIFINFKPFTFKWQHWVADSVGGDGQADAGSSTSFFFFFYESALSLPTSKHFIQKFFQHLQI